VNTPAVAEAVETRQDQESRRLRELSHSTLLYMIGYGVSLENWLMHHRMELGYVADETFDLLEAMRLSTRLKRVETNISRAGRSVAVVRAELVRRQTGGS
jgi:hypothetical protein